MIEFGTGLTLNEHCPYLRDAAERADRILDAAERNSVIEGLPPFTEKFRQRLRAKLIGQSEPRQAPAE